MCIYSSPSEDIYAVNGKELKYTFTYSKDMNRSYTFEYADECGNEGKPVTVTLADELIMTPYETPVPEEGEEREDKDAPVFQQRCMPYMMVWLNTKHHGILTVTPLRKLLRT